MREQLGKIVEFSRLPRVTVQIIPYTAGAHPGLNGAFSILEFSDYVPDLVYIEGMIDRPYVERPDELERYRIAFERLRKIAMTPEQSVEFLVKTRAVYESILNNETAAVL